MHPVGFLLTLNYDARNHKLKKKYEFNLNICLIIIIIITNFNNIKSFQTAAKTFIFHEAWLLNNVKRGFRKVCKERLFNYSRSLRPDASYRHPLCKHGCYVTQKRAVSRAKKLLCDFLTKRRYYKGQIKISSLSKFYLKGKMV